MPKQKSRAIQFAPAVGAMLMFAVVLALCWAVTISMSLDFYAALSGGAHLHSSMILPSGESWSIAYFLMIFLMWAIMMAAMMLPSMLVTLRAYFQFASAKGGGAAGLSAILALGYLTVWGGFSFVISIMQYFLARFDSLDSAMSLGNSAMGGGILIAAGIYQFSALKNSCLKYCREPLFFFLLNWRKGIDGAFLMGIKNGVFCLGCCWAIMLLLFAGGAMNLWWIIPLAIYACAEKILPLPIWIYKAAGGGAIAGGVFLIAI